MNSKVSQEELEKLEEELKEEVRRPKRIEKKSGRSVFRLKKIIEESVHEGKKDLKQSG